MGTKPVEVLAVCAGTITLFSTADVTPALADDLSAAVYNGVNQERLTAPASGGLSTTACAPIGVDPRLTAAAQRHANDMLTSGVGGHTGSDGSSPESRIGDAGYTQIGRSSEIVYWGTGALATPAAALDLWMKSPGHRAAILNCAFTAGGFATASDGNKMTAVVDFAAP
jgi:uncharacterized protein YkwD